MKISGLWRYWLSHDFENHGNAAGGGSKAAGLGSITALLRLKNKHEPSRFPVRLVSAVVSPPKRDGTLCHSN